MKLTGHACTKALNEAEEDETRERAEGNAGGVRVERRVRPMLVISWQETLGLSRPSKGIVHRFSGRE